MKHSELAYKQTIEVLQKLVEGLDDTYWSSWQSTASFYPAYEDAKAYLSLFSEDYRDID